MFHSQYWRERRSLIWCATFIIVALAVQGSALQTIAQETTANIVGTAADTAGVVVPYARVSVTSDSTGLERQTTADQGGLFFLPALPPGTYTLTAQRDGFSQVRVTGLQLQAGTSAKVSVQFSPVVTLRGRVIDFKTAEPIAKVLVSIRSQKLDAVTNDVGRFELVGVEPGEVELFVSTVGYGLLKTTLQVAASVPDDVELEIGQEALKRVEQVTVTSGPFESVEPGASTEQVLQAADLKNLSSMFGDAFRSIHSLPGVAAPDDYYSDFAYRGAGVENIAFYMDGVLINDPFHELQQLTDMGSISLLNGDTIESISLLGGGFPAKYGDRTAAVVNVQTREAGRDKVSMRINMDCFQAGATAEGPLGSAKKVAWLVTARKSYLQYLLNRLNSSGLAIGYYDTEAKLTWDPSQRHHLSLLAINGPASVDVTYQNPADTLQGRSRADIVSMSWQWTPWSSAVLRTALNYGRENDHNQMDNADLLRSKTQDIGFRHDATIPLTPHYTIEAGVEAHDARQNYLSNYEWNVSTGRPWVNPTPLAQFGEQVWRYGAYFQPSWKALQGRILLTAGGRFDHFDFTSQNVWLPRASVSIGLTSRTKVLAGYGQYAQYPELVQLLGDFRNPALRAERSTHYILGFEQQISERVRFKIDLYDREETEKPYSTETEWRLVGGQVLPPLYGQVVLANSVRGYSRGVEFSLQRVSANRLSGWLSYAFGHARYHDTLSHLYFDGDYDQRHIGTAFASYRLSPTVNLSGKYRYESNFPIVGFFQGDPALDDQHENFTLSDQRNQLRVPVYSRLDIRLNKAFYYRRSKMTMYGEIDNLLDHTNWRYFGLRQYDFTTGQAQLRRDKMLPILPAAGFTIEF